MRILFVSGPLFGHVNTLLPLALAACQAGHEVRFATGPEFADNLAQRGLRAWPVGLTHAQAGGSRQESWLAYFEATADRRMADLLARLDDWRPDMVVHEETELAGVLAAVATRSKHVMHGLGIMPSRRIGNALQQALERLGAKWGVPDAAASLAHASYLHICPPSLRDNAEAPLWTNVHTLRPAAGLPLPDQPLALDLRALPYAKTIHLTLGTVFNGNVDVLQRAVAALRDLQANLVVTVGADADPDALGPQPAHVHVARYLPHAQLLPHCDLVVSQGGAGILFGALAHGLPQLVLPQGADQFGNAEAAQRSGAALALVGADATQQAIHAHAQRLLSETSFGAAAREVAREITAMPSAQQVIEQLTRDKSGRARIAAP